MLFVCGLQIHMGEMLTFFSPNSTCRKDTLTQAVNVTALKKRSLYENQRYRERKK